MKTYHWIAAGLGFLMFLVSIWQLETADSGLVVTNTRVEELPVTLISPSGDDFANWPVIMATAILAMVPPVLVVVAMQRLFIKGLIEVEK